jgi:UDP-N-acetylmuramate dehydrogenase
LRKLSGATARLDSASGRFEIECLAGTSKSDLLKIYLKARLAPALFLAGLPGDVGGGVAMNAGVGETIRPREFVELVDWIEVLRFDTDATVERIGANDLNWSYRRCEGWQPGAIVRVQLSCPNEPQADVLDRVRDANRVRLSKQPLDQPSCGSVFMNPPGGKAGQLIESCGLKGFACGGARVSEKHANFIVNGGGATATEIQAVVDHVRETVRTQTGIELHSEYVRLGR